jgi:hypothetical protein
MHGLYRPAPNSMFNAMPLLFNVGPYYVRVLPMLFNGMQYLTELLSLMALPLHSATGINPQIQFFCCGVSVSCDLEHKM